MIYLRPRAEVQRQEFDGSSALLGGLVGGGIGGAIGAAMGSDTGKVIGALGGTLGETSNIKIGGNIVK